MSMTKDHEITLFKNHEILKSLLASHATVHSCEIQKNMDVI